MTEIGVDNCKQMITEIKFQKLKELHRESAKSHEIHQA